MRVAIFCGASTGNDPIIHDGAKDLMDFFSKKNIGLVYGGGGIGVMGILANRLMELNGEVIGVIPQRLMKKEVAHPGLTQLHVVKDMHERKQMMYDLSDAFLILPGGFGTMDEFFEILTWKQLGTHNKPIIVWNLNGYYDQLMGFVHHALKVGFVKSIDTELFFVVKKQSELETKLGL